MGYGALDIEEVKAQLASLHDQICEIDRSLLSSQLDDSKIPDHRRVWLTNRREAFAMKYTALHDRYKV